MRAAQSLKLVPVVLLVLGCSDTSGPNPPPPSDDPGSTVLTVSPSFATIDGQRFVKLTAILSGGDAPGTPQSAIKWFSSDTNVATVRAGGLVEGRKAGRVQISANYKTAHGSATVVVLKQVTKKPGGPPCLLIPGGKC